MIPSLILNQTLLHVIDIWNKFHQNIKITYKIEHNGKTSF